MENPAAVQTPVPQAGQEPDALRQSMHRVRAEVSKAVVGQDGAVSGLLIALLSRGHVLLEGVPGVAKTLLVRAFSRALGLDTKRIQFTPDLMPGDVSGSLIYDAKSGEFEFREGPVFTNIVLADEINRTPPKTQAALLEAMEERQVSADGVTRPLPDPFLVCATQNPVEHEGTYTLPEAQLDRFLLKLLIDVPPRDAEVAVLRRHADGFTPRELGGIAPVVAPDEILAAQRSAAAVTVTDDVLAYVVDLARATRQSPSVQLGASPRASTALLAAAKAWAWLGGYPAITPDHVQAMLVPVWRHRIRLRPDAEIEGVSVDAVLNSVVQQTPVPL
ncbi:MoxR family ATPase [Microbacterium paludicola]|uniref:MoxR family ATPase n=1 Tax=Microbacterium paludicola TaxID=300019 RepID=A0A4Y9G180_9MICO|nr:MoxR family ATPase [Microbacterium paludicola]MBF0815184.1 MoxR family ATPase [Microbacterium paludicola]TFU34440.1 MoxR family ATPase [Microbacterium paludicola]